MLYSCNSFAPAPTRPVASYFTILFNVAEQVAQLGPRLETALAPDAVLPTIVESVSSIWLIEHETLHLAARCGVAPRATTVRDAPGIAALRSAARMGSTQLISTRPGCTVKRSASTGCLCCHSPMARI